MSSSEEKKIPKKRHTISLKMKMYILDRLKNGERAAHISRSLALNEATIRCIQKNELKIRKSVADGCSTSANVTYRPRASILLQMENRLNSWIDDNDYVSTSVILEKALDIYNALKEEGLTPTVPDFVASKGWYHRFQRRRNLIKQQKTDFDIPPDYMFSVDQSNDIEECEKKLPSKKKKTKVIKSSLNECALSNVTVEIKDEENGESDISKENLDKIINLAKDLEMCVLNEDPNCERRIRFQQDLLECMGPYLDLFEELNTI